MNRFLERGVCFKPGFVSAMPWSEWVAFVAPAVILALALAGLVVCFWALLRGRPAAMICGDLGRAPGRGRVHFGRRPFLAITLRSLRGPALPGRPHSNQPRRA